MRLLATCATCAVAQHPTAGSQWSGIACVVPSARNNTFEAILQESGDIVTSLATLSVNGSYYPDAVQLPNGNIVIAWTNGNVYYAVLNAGLGIVKDVTWLSNSSPMGDYYVSVTPERQPRRAHLG